MKYVQKFGSFVNLERFHSHWEGKVDYIARIYVVPYYMKVSHGQLIHFSTVLSCKSNNWATLRCNELKKM